MASEPTTAFDAAEYLDSPEAITAYLADAMTDPDPSELIHALGVIARAKGMTQIAEQSGLARPALYRALTHDSRPEYATVIKVMRALGIELQPVVAG